MGHSRYLLMGLVAIGIVTALAACGEFRAVDKRDAAAADRLRQLRNKKPVPTPASEDELATVFQKQNYAGYRNYSDSLPAETKAEQLRSQFLGADVDVTLLSATDSSGRTATTEQVDIKVVLKNSTKIHFIRIPAHTIGDARLAGMYTEITNSTTLAQLYSDLAAANALTGEGSTAETAGTDPLITSADLTNSNQDAATNLTDDPTHSQDLRAFTKFNEQEDKFYVLLTRDPGFMANGQKPSNQVQMVGLIFKKSSVGSQSNTAHYTLNYVTGGQSPLGVQDALKLEKVSVTVEPAKNPNSNSDSVTTAPTAPTDSSVPTAAPAAPAPIDPNASASQPPATDGSVPAAAEGQQAAPPIVVGDGVSGAVNNGALAPTPGAANDVGSVMGTGQPSPELLDAYKHMGSDGAQAPSADQQQNTDTAPDLTR